MNLHLGGIKLRPLTEREKECLVWICKGKTYGEIANIIGISKGSVKTYLDNSRYKLNAINLPQACALVIAYNIISRDEITNGHYTFDDD
jgi:DNA-binding CsgD family transcriptional regulator